MKNYFTLKRLSVAAMFLVAGVCHSFANEDEIIWVKSETYPTGAGTVYIDWSTNGDHDKTEFKRFTNGAISEAFIWAQPADGWLWAGVARDNGNGTYDNGVDLQVKIREDGFFTAVPYPDKISGQSTSDADEKAQAALDAKTTPSDLIFAVFTKGAVSRVAPDEIGHGNAYADKLYSEPGDEVTFSAYGDSFSKEAGGVDYYKFSHWTNANGETVGTERELKVTVKGMDIYYAHFVTCTQDEYKASEKDPHKSESYYDPTAIKTVAGSKIQASDSKFNLSGQRVGASYRGIAIQNGRKVILK